MTTKRIAAVVILVLLVAFWLWPMINSSSNKDESAQLVELEDAVAWAILEEQLGRVSVYPDGAFIARVLNTADRGSWDSALLLWKVIGDGLEPVDEDTDVGDYMIAINSGSPKDWPYFVVVFSFLSVESDRARVDVQALYDTGSSAQDRERSAAVWEFEKRGGQWEVSATEVYQTQD